MFRKRCTLCGGKLVDNKCILCGLDNSKTDANYKLNVSSCDGEPLTHVHEDKKEKRYPRRKPVSHTIPNKKKSRKGWLVVVFVIVLILGIEEIKGLISGILDRNAERTYEVESVGTGPIEYDGFQYDYVTRELSEDGQVYDADFGQGHYIVGVHIPEGTYTVESDVDKYTYLNLEDSENRLYIGEYFDAKYKKIEDLRCYTGAKLRIDGDAVLHFHSENAQSDALEYRANPLQEAVDVKDEYVAGIDFPAGTYDIVEAENSNVGTEVSYVVPGTVIESSDIEGYEPVTDMLWVTSYEQPFTYRNLFFPEGTEIRIEEGETVHLEPSVVVAKSYIGYYYTYG